MTGLAIFDLDGTLVDSAAVCTGIVNEMLAARGSGRKITVAEAAPYISLGGPRMVAALLADACGDPEAEIREFRERYASGLTPANSVYEGVREGVEALRSAGVPMAICSNKPQNLCEKVLGELGMVDFFDAIVGGGPGIAPKPAPDLLALTLARTGGSVDNSVFVGDSELDHELARGVGMPFIFVTYGYADPEWDFSGAWHCDSFAAAASQAIDILHAGRHLPRVALRA